MLSDMVKVVIYARVSTKDQEREGYSIPSQLLLLREYAQKHRFEVIQEFIESESAGKAGRSKLGQMVELLKRDHSITAILVEKVDRLYRNFKDQVMLADMGIDIHFVKDGRIIGKDSKPSDKLVHDIETAQARYYLNNLSQEVKKGHDEKARQGKYPCGQIPLGYLRDPITKAITIDPFRGDIVRELFELYSDGEHSIDELHSFAIRAGLNFRKSGRRINRAEVERLLKRIFYTGQFSWHGQIIRGDHPPIVSVDLYEKVQAAFKSRSRGRFSNRDFVFSRMIKCADCECAVTAEIKKKRYIYYHCTGFSKSHRLTYVSESNLDAQFAKIVGRVTLPYAWYDYLKAALETEQKNRKSNAEKERERLEITRDKIQSDMKRAFQSKLDDSIPEDFFRSVFEDYQRRLKEIEFRLSNLGPSIDQEFDIALKAIELSYQAEELYLRANQSQKRKLLKSLLSNCKLEGSTLYPTYNKPFDTLVKGLSSNNIRRVRDSNPRSLAGQRFSRPPQSTALPTLRTEYIPRTDSEQPKSDCRKCD